jgi:hypothetical protein
MNEGARRFVMAGDAVDPAAVPWRRYTPARILSWRQAKAGRWPCAWMIDNPSLTRVPGLER